MTKINGGVRDIFNRLQSFCFVLFFFCGMLAGIKKQHISHSWVEKFGVS